MITFLHIFEGIFIFITGWNLGRIYSFRHEVKIAQDGWRKTLDEWEKSNDELFKLVKMSGNKIPSPWQQNH